jgi:hypothetical protein
MSPSSKGPDRGSDGGSTNAPSVIITLLHLRANGDVFDLCRPKADKSSMTLRLLWMRSTCCQGDDANAMLVLRPA